MYEQMDGVALGLPLSLIVVNLYMEYFEGKVLNSYPIKPKMWKRFVDDTNIIWPHGRENLDTFLVHLNNQFDHIKFTMEVEENNFLPFLDVLLTRKTNGTIARQVFRKRTHRDKYLQVDSHHHPSQKLGILNTLATRAIRIADKEHINGELKHLRIVLKNNGYDNRDITRAFNKARDPKERILDNVNESIMVLPYIQGTTDRMEKILRKGK